ncbi:MAG: hypothetical protein Kow0079_01890 [Vicingaceae bacterium]
MKTLKSLIVIACIIPFYSIAQTGPGGVGNSSNNVIWLDGNKFTYSTAPYINTWDDQSGNGNNFIQSNASRQPRRVSYSGFNAIRFDGSDDFVRAGAIGALNANKHSQFIVYNGNTSNHTGIVYESSFSESSQFIRSYRSGGNFNSWVLNSSLGVVKNTAINDASFQIMTSIWDGNAQTFDSYKNGTSFGSKTGANGNPTGNYRNTVGAASNNAYRFNGDIGEIIIYNIALNSAQKNIVENYLSSKFGTSISNDLYSYDGTHKYEVFGIGQEADGNNLAAQGTGIVKFTGAGFANGDYILSGNDNTSLSLFNSDVPASLSGGTRLSRVWRTDVTGTPPAITVEYDVTGLPLSGSDYYLLVDDDGDFSNGGTTTYGPSSPVGNIVTFAGVSFADGNYYSLATGASNAIISVKTGDWHTSSTWNCNCVPTPNDSIVVSSGHTVTISSNDTINDLTISGTLDASSVSLYIKGELVYNPGASFQNKRVYFNGTSAQTITNTSGNVLNFQTVYFQNPSGVTIASGETSITNSLSVTNGTLTNNGGAFTFLSNATQTAVIINGSGGFSGNFICQRYISSRNASWGDLTSPVAGLKLRQWDANPAGTATEIYMSNVGGIDGNAGNFFSVWDWNETTQKYDSITDTTYVVPTGMGIEIWLEDSNSVWESKTIDSRGTPHSGTLPIAVVNSWNLVGNPYQAWIDWAKLTKPTLNSTYYIWNTNNASYDAKTSGAIPPHQAFWVESVGAGTLTFSESSKIGSGSSTFWREINTNLIVEENYAYYEGKIVITNPENNYNTTAAFRLSDISSSDEDYFDGSYRKGRIIETPEVYSHPPNSNRKLSINSFTNDADELIFPVVLKVSEANNYKLSFSGFKDFSTFYNNVLFVDKINNKVYNVANDREIEIYLDPMNFNDEQFELRFNNNLNSISANHNINIYKTEDFTIIETDESNLNITVYNAIGQEILNNIKTNGKITYIPNNKIPKGVNIISVQANDETITKKLMY